MNSKIDLSLCVVENPTQAAALRHLVRDECWIDPGLQVTLWPYFSAIESSSWKENMVAVLAGDKPIMLLAACRVGGVIGCFRRSLRPIYKPGLDQVLKDRATALVVETAIRSAKDNDEKFTLVTEPSCEAYLQDWQLNLMKNGATFRQAFHAIVDLTLPETSLKKNTRKSYKSLINWGRRNITADVIDAQTATAADFENFRLFHKRISGRATRPVASWNEMYELTIQGRALLVRGYLEDQLVSATFVVHDNRLGVYATGVYERSLFDKPISHWPLYKAILELKARGLQRFDLGEVYLSGEHSDKEGNISHFKKGFSKAIYKWDVWDMQK